MDNMDKLDMDEAAVALLVLGGCPKCAKAFRTDTQEFYCCGVGYCPYCALPHTARCPHMIAYSEWGKWRIAGKQLQKRGVPRYPLPHDSAIDYSPEQIRQAIGVDEPYFRVFHSESGREKPLSGHYLREMLSEKLFCERLFAIALPEHRRVVTQHKNNGHYIFAHSGNDLDARLSAVWNRLVPAMERLAPQKPLAERFLRAVLRPQMDWGITCGGFSPDGSRFYIGNDARFLVYDLQTLEGKQVFERPDGYFVSGVFTDNDTLALRFTYHSPEIDLQEIDNPGDDILYSVNIVTGEYTARSAPADPGRRTLFDDTWQRGSLTEEEWGRTLHFNGSGTLHGGKTSCIVQERDIVVFRAPEDATVSEPRPVLTLTTVSLQPLGAFSPDGEHFLTSNHKAVFVWRMTEAGMTEAAA